MNWLGWLGVSVRLGVKLYYCHFFNLLKRGCPGKTRFTNTLTTAIQSMCEGQAPRLNRTAMSSFSRASFDNLAN